MIRDNLGKTRRGLIIPSVILLIITLLTACKSTTVPVNTVSETPPAESPDNTYIDENTDEPETQLKTGTYAYDCGIYTEEMNFDSAFFGTGERYAIDCDNLLFAVLDLKTGKVKENSILPSEHTYLSNEGWEGRFADKVLFKGSGLNRYKSRVEYAINEKYSLLLMDGDLCLGFIDSEAEKDNSFNTIIKLKLEDESTDSVEALKISNKLLKAVVNRISESKGRYCQVVNTEVGDYGYEFDGSHISASLTLAINWRYEGYDNPNSFNYGRPQLRSTYSIAAEADTTSDYYIKTSRLKITADGTDISGRNERDAFAAMDVEGAFDYTLAKKLQGKHSEFSYADISIGPDLDVGSAETDTDSSYLNIQISWRVLRAYNDMELPEGHCITLTHEDGDTLTFYEGTDIARYTSGAETEYYRTGVMLYDELLPWALRNKDRFFISEELAAKIAAGKADTDPVTAYVWSMIEEDALTQAKSSCYISDGTYFKDAEISRLELAESYDSLIEGAVAELWVLRYAIEAEDISKIMLAGGMNLDERGWLMNTGSMGGLHPVVINRGGVREVVGAVYYLGYRGFALGNIRELLDTLGITGGWFKSFYDSLTPALTYADKGKAEKTINLTDEEMSVLWNMLSAYKLSTSEGMISEEYKDGVLWLGGPDRGIEFICGTDIIIVHDGYDSTMYGTINKDDRDGTALPQAVTELYNSK